MKNSGWIIIGLIVVIFLLTKDYYVNDTDTRKSSSSYAGNETALKLIRMESKVKEALITEADVLYVSVVDDGTKRDGYASYLCEILREKGAKANRVKVVKVNSTNDPNRDNAYGVLLGESWCK